MNNNSDPSQKFSTNQIVFLKSDPTIRGPVLQVLPGTPENRISVWIDGKSQTFYASQLQSEIQSAEDLRSVSCDEFHAYLTALQIAYPVGSILYSLNAAGIDFIPYQYRPVLKIIRAERPRLLIADSVGVGKTIEAGLILRELQARRDIRSVLVICPRPLVTEEKWQREMKRFDEDFEQLDGHTLGYCINETHLDGEWPDRFQKIILPYSLLNNNLLFGSAGKSKKKSEKGLLDLDPPPQFDLVIVDEAHHIRNQDTANYEAVRFFCEHAEAALFLTATPIQLRYRDLFVLLNVLRPDLIIDESSFKHMGEPNPFINQAIDAARSRQKDWRHHAKEALNKAVATAWGQAILKGKPEFKRIQNQIANRVITSEERVQLITEMEALYTFSSIINRTRRRDIGEFTVRKPRTEEVKMTNDQVLLHDVLLETQKEIYRRLHKDKNILFMMTTLRRQAASCLYGLVPFLEQILNRHLHKIDPLEWVEVDERVEVDDTGNIPLVDALDPIRTEIESILHKARELNPYDPKLDKLRNLLREKQQMPNNRVMVFSSFRHTLAYLYSHLKADGIRVEMVHGGTPDEERREIRNKFEQPREVDDSLDVILFSEVGCEGLDYQCCDCIINYDLPWNPMRIEQRIGRIDRIGQTSESVVIINMVTPGTIDAEIYERCLNRIGIFERALGGGEEILGKITKKIYSIAENFTLSVAERQEQFQQLEDNEIRLIQEQENLEESELELFGLRVPKDQMQKDIDKVSSFWLTPESVQRLVTFYLRHKLGTDQEFILGQNPLKTLRLSGEARNILLRDFQQLSRERSPVYRKWENWLKGANQHLPITFESDCRRQHPEVSLIMPIHPLVKQASRVFIEALTVRNSVERKVITKLKVRTEDVPIGSYEFAIYQWHFRGIKEDLELKPIALDEILAPHLDKLIPQAVDYDNYDILNSNNSDVWDDLDKQHYQLWMDALERHRRETRELVESRRENLLVNHHDRIAILEDQRSRVDDPNIRRMRESQIANAEVDCERRIKALDESLAQVDIRAEPVAYGILQVESGT